MVEYEWRRHRADQLREKAKEDAIVIVPVGSLEQHGPHLPVEIDTLLGEAVALRTARLAAEREKVLVLPMLWTGLSEHHMVIAPLLEKQSGLWHACEAETSMCMALHPELVAEGRIRLAEVNTTPDVAEIVGPGVYRWRSLVSRSSAGVIGYPSAASAEKGEKLLAAISRDLADKLCNKELRTLPWR